MKTLLSTEQLRAGLARVAEDLRSQYGATPVTIVGIMTGSIVMVADLIRLLEMPLRVGFVQASSYRGGTQRGRLELSVSSLIDIRGRHVLLVDDIFDTGHTLEAMLKLMREHQPASLRSLVLLRKSERGEVETQPDFVAFEIPDEFVVGYGLDFEDEYRNLPFVAALEPEDVARHRDRGS